MAIMPDPLDTPTDPDYRFVVLGHPELGEFLEWDPAVAAAWTVTAPGHSRVPVTMAHKGVVQLRTEDPDPDPRFTVVLVDTGDQDWPWKVIVRDTQSDAMVTHFCQTREQAEAVAAYAQEVFPTAQDIFAVQRAISRNRSA